MATGPGFPSATNGYIPNWEASGRLAVGFSRNTKDWAINRLAQYVKSERLRGYYLKITAQEAARVVNTNDYLWGFGNERPLRDDGLESFNFKEFTALRYDYGFNLDEETTEQSEWPVAEAHAQIHSQKAMTARTILGFSVLTTASNWQTAADGDLSADHTATANSLAGGYLDQGTSVAPYLKKALDKISVLINLDTLGVVTDKNLHVTMNPNTARLLAESPEIHDYIKGSPAAIEEIRTASSPNARYGPGLPSNVYGYPINVDQTVKITSRKGGSLTKAFAFPDQTIAITARVGELEGVYGLPSFSTLTYFWFKDNLTLERFGDPENRRNKYSVVDCFVPILTAPLSGYLITSATSVAS